EAPWSTPAHASSSGTWRLVLRDLRAHWLGTRALTRELLRGVPAEMRLELWARALDVAALQGEHEARGDSFAALRARAEGGALAAGVEQQIALDLTRTMHTHALFQQAATQRVLGTLLQAYALLVPGTAYCQGM